MQWLMMMVISFLSTPSVRRATEPCNNSGAQKAHFYPRPPCGGRLGSYPVKSAVCAFLSTPSVRRATFSRCAASSSSSFLSTPSVRRATIRSRFRLRRGIHFYPRPPCGGRPCGSGSDRPCQIAISIHALRAEGDLCPLAFLLLDRIGFLSTPSVRRATDQAINQRKHDVISIHALRAEGDGYFGGSFLHTGQDFYPRPPCGGRPCRPGS